MNGGGRALPSSCSVAGAILRNGDPHTLVWSPRAVCLGYVNSPIRRCVAKNMKVFGIRPKHLIKARRGPVALRSKEKRSDGRR